MKLDLNLLNRLGEEVLDSDVEIPSEYYKNTDIIRINKLHLEGRAEINYVDELELTANLKGEIVLPCSRTLEEVNYKIDTEITENLGNFTEILQKNKNLLDITEVICENIVLEIPMRVVKEGLIEEHLSGDGWELSDE